MQSFEFQNSPDSGGRKREAAGQGKEPAIPPSGLPEPVRGEQLFRPEIDRSVTDGSNGRNNSSSSVFERAINAVVNSGPVIAGIGSTIVAIPISKVGAIAFGITTLWSAINEVRSVLRNAETQTITPEEIKVPLRKGLTGFFIEQINSPSLCTWLQSWCFLYSSVPAFTQGKLVAGLSFLVFAIGEGAGSAIGNRDYKPKPRQLMDVEKVLNKIWDGLPHGLKIVLKDPGAAFCSGNLALVVTTLNFSQIFQSHIASVLVGGGIIIAGLGALRGIAPLVTGRQASASGTASITGGIADILLGASSLYFGCLYVGLATVTWGVSNIMYGKKVGSAFFSKIVDKLFKK